MENGIILFIQIIFYCCVLSHQNQSGSNGKYKVIMAAPIKTKKNQVDVLLQECVPLAMCTVACNALVVRLQFSFDGLRRARERKIGKHEIFLAIERIFITIADDNFSYFRSILTASQHTRREENSNNMASRFSHFSFELFCQNFHLFRSFSIFYFINFGAFNFRSLTTKPWKLILTLRIDGRSVYSLWSRCRCTIVDRPALPHESSIEEKKKKTHTTDLPSERHERKNIYTQIAHLVGSVSVRSQRRQTGSRHTHRLCGEISWSSPLHCTGIVRRDIQFSYSIAILYLFVYTFTVCNRVVASDGAAVSNTIVLWCVCVMHTSYAIGHLIYWLPVV